MLSLVIGIDAYPQAPLKGCINDATAFAKMIHRNGDGSVNSEVHLQTDIRTKSHLTSLIHELFQADTETVLLYFSGHGYINEFGGYIVTPDAKIFDEGVSMDQVLEMANASKARNRIIILDCCYSGAFGEARISAGVTTRIAGGVTILTASRKDQVAMEVDGHGVFTHLLLLALEGGAADIRGHITPGSVYTYIDMALGQWGQRPVFKTNITRFISLREIIPQLHREILRKITSYFKNPENEFPLDPSYEDTNVKGGKYQPILPYADAGHVAIFKDLQKLQSVGLLVPVDADFMFFAALNSKSCKLTPLGHHYWRLVKGHHF